jgi:hypothetical protein
MKERTDMTDWFARPVLHVTDVDASIRFYVDRQGCALILASHWPEKAGKGLMFISMNVEPETHEAAVAALDALRELCTTNQFEVRKQALSIRRSPIWKILVHYP